MTLEGSGRIYVTVSSLMFYLPLRNSLGINIGINHKDLYQGNNFKFISIDPFFCNF